MRRIPALAAVALAATACSQDTPIEDVTWQMTNIYQEGYPSEVPENSPIVPRITFGYVSVVGDTGCAPFHAHITYHDDQGQQIDPLSAATLRMEDLRVDDAREQCEGRQRFLHDSLVRMLPNEYRIEREAGTLLLTQTGQLIDAPAIRMVNTQ